MPPLALVDALPDFGAAAITPPQRDAGDKQPYARVGEQPAAKAAAGDEIARAVAQAEAALLERVAHEYAEKLAAEHQAHRQEIESLEEQLGAKAGETIAARFAEMERDTVALTAGLAARILSIALTEDLQSRSVARLSEILADVMRDREAVRITVRGSALLCNQLRTGLGERAAQVEFIEAPGLDLSAQIDESVFETRLAEWSETLSEVLS